MNPREVLSRAAPEPDATLRYGELPEQVADLYLPRPAPDAPPSGGHALDALVIAVHGGFWRAEYDRMHLRPLCVGLAESGATVVSIEFRRIGQPDGGWPGTFDDVATAIDVLPAQVRATCAGAGPAPARTVLVGHSAGGQLVVWAAGRPSLPATSPWHRPDVGADAVVSLAGVVDLGLAHRLALDGGATDDLLGGSPVDVPDRYAATDPMFLAPHVPVVQVHGTGDDRVPIEVGRSYVSRGAAGVRMVELPGVEHFGLIDPLSSAWPTVLEAVQGPARES